MAWNPGDGYGAVVDRDALWGYTRRSRCKRPSTPPQRTCATLDGWSASGPKELVADLALEGGGVKGIGIVGAVSVLAEAGYRFQRVAGTSAGAIAATLIASISKAGHR